MPSSGSTTIDRLVLRLYTIQSISESPANTSSLVGSDVDIFPQEQNNPQRNLSLAVVPLGAVQLSMRPSAS